MQRCRAGLLACHSAAGSRVVCIRLAQRLLLFFVLLLYCRRCPLFACSPSLSASPSPSPAPATPAAAFDLQTCAAQEYLARTVFPALNHALQMLEHVRPEEPVEYLAMQLYKEASTNQRRVQQLNQIHALREQLREQFNQEYSVEGRI